MTNKSELAKYTAETKAEFSKLIMSNVEYKAIFKGAKNTGKFRAEFKDFKNQ